MNQPVNKGISVILCCYNSANKLAETLKHIAAQKTDEALNWQLILVDNKSTDSTTEVATKIWADLKAPQEKLIIVQEPKAGLGHARKKGVKCADYEYIIFCDDDNWLCSGYLQEINNIFAIHANVGYIGTKAKAVFEDLASKPSWFKENTYAYAVGEQFETTGKKEQIFIWGAGFSIRREALLSILLDDYPLLLAGREGKKLSSGEDSEICVRLKMANYNLYYTNSIYLQHYIPTYKLEEKYRKSLNKGFDESNKIIEAYIRVIDFDKYSFLEKSVKVIKETLRYLFPTSLHRRANASRFLFLLTGLQYFGDQNDRLILAYSKHLKSSVKDSANK